MQRDYRFDVIRVMALSFILVCHFATNLAGRIALGVHDVLAQTGIYTFFLISGWLLGMKWRRTSGGGGGYGIAFLWHCAKRIYIPLWSFLVPYLVWRYLHSGGLDAKAVVMNLAGLSWFSKYGEMAYLWYVTLALMFYVFVVPLSWIPRRWLDHARVVFFASLIVTLAVQYVLFSVGIKQLYLACFLWGGSMLFLFGDKVLRWIEDHGQGRGYRVGLTMLIALTWTALWVIGYCDAFATRYWITSAAAMGTMALVISLCQGRRPNKFVTWASVISFDVYLVHTLFRGRWVREFCGNDAMWFVIYIGGSFVVAAALHAVRSRIMKALKWA